MRKLKQHLLVLILLISSLGISYEGLSQNTTSSSKSNTIIIKPSIPEGFELVDTPTLKMLFAVKERLEETNKAAELVIQAQKEDITKAKEIINAQDELISRYQRGVELTELSVTAYRSDISFLSKENKKLKRQVVLFKTLNVVIPVGIAVGGYFLLK